MNKTLFLIPAIMLLAGCLDAAEDQPQKATLFPEPEVLESGHLQVSDLHKIYYWTAGNPDGKPVICLHGGPGVGSYPRLAQYFDPEKFFLVLHDQRGSGRSEPFGELKENTTDNLVEDIEKLRNHFGLEKVLIFGGSWGTTLGLAYAEKYPENVSGLLLRGIFLGTDEEVEFHYRHTGFLFPARQEKLLSVLPDRSRGIDPDYLYELLTGDDRELALKVMHALHRFEFKFMALNLPDELIEQFLSTIPDEAALLTTRIDLHYVSNRYFMEKDQLLKNIGKLKDIPAILINGRYDMASPPRAAFRVHQALPESKLIIVEEAGHSEREEGITEALLEAAREFE